MLDKIIQFSIREKLLVALLTLALIAWGGYSLTRLPIDAVPDITDNQVMVITVAPSLAAQEIEQLVTFPVEQSLVSIPGIDEMRSFSRFGLSIVTIVFAENVELYWARQQVQERLTHAAKDIPEAIGKPAMAPVTTGLGEIYQYEIHAAKGYESRYDATALRTIQDWIIKRQLLGTPGVAEVSGFGGLVKQYEIAVDPDRLRSHDLSIANIFTALEANNQNTGGAYIDKNPNAYFIRSEGLVRSLDDLGMIVVGQNAQGAPLLVRDVATVRFGHGPRYGAATRNGEGEVVTGIVLMLKGANSSQVISAVKDRIEQIKTTLPEGVVIEAFLDRKKLVDNAIGTVTTNLIEGALIVVFVLVLFLGNLRGGLVVASVIPLSMLFAVSLMNLFGVSGNLMSLGAIDFGLIVDGAVIIVEAVMHRISHSSGTYPGAERLTQGQMDVEVYESTSRIRTSAAFGELIILIVYLPLLALIGVEGKMFRPMAQTVSFAILGAFLLSVTYVPMMSALLLSRKTAPAPNFSDRMMEFFQRMYRPVIVTALRHRKLVILSAAGLCMVSVFAFSRLGSEFIPQLDEGDFAVETRVPVGSSIHQVIDVSQKAQRIMLANFPEVTQVVSKIGSGEIPTDPMPIEAGDMMVILKPRAEWTSADTREGLIEKMESALTVIPNASFSFQQPIQMRFNELLTGAKQDVVIKLYGENLDLLSDLAADVGRRIGGVDGVDDLYVEQSTGLPQIQIKLDRDRIAQYGMSVSSINQAIEIGFAGRAAGVVYEGERRFDLVVRLDSASRTDITDVENLFVKSSAGRLVPLREVARVVYEPGPVQIQRDNAKRRVTIGFNVRRRDVQSIVSDVRRIIDEQVQFPAGYYVTYGGQFENLQKANQRLAIAVPVALALILLLLYFTFGSITQSLLIFTAIPLSAIGGVFALVLRGMPFSISAGVGFIALFGVSVLNGIVLIAEFNRLAAEGIEDVHERILQGTRIRLRPVLMTALVASLGFRPMALSSTAGAEVQRPLATVVIGGLVSATLLTLVVLPILYAYSMRNQLRKLPWRRAAGGVAVLVTLLVPMRDVRAQVLPAQVLPVRSSPARKLTLAEAVDEVVRRNGSVRIARYEVELQRTTGRAALAIPRTDVSLTRGQFNTPGVGDVLLNVSQRLDFPTVYPAQAALTGARVASSARAMDVQVNALTMKVRSAYLQLQYLDARRRLLVRQDSLFRRLDRSSRLRYETGESTRLESVTSAARALRQQNAVAQNAADLRIAERQLQVLLQSSEAITIADTTLVPSTLLAQADLSALDANPQLAYLDREVLVSRRVTRLEQQRRLPDLLVAYNRQSFRGAASSGLSGTLGAAAGTVTDGDRFSFYQLGVALPLAWRSTNARVAGARISESIVRTERELAEITIRGELQRLLEQREKLSASLAYFTLQALPQAALIVANSDTSFRTGDISYVQHLQNLSLASEIETEYLDTMLQYNQAVIELAAILGIR